MLNNIKDAAMGLCAPLRHDKPMQECYKMIKHHPSTSTQHEEKDVRWRKRNKRWKD